MKKYYAGHSYMGINYEYSAGCWKAYEFDTNEERAAWLEANEYDNGNLVAEKITKKVAYKIAGVDAHNEPIVEHDGRLTTKPCF